MKSLRFLPFVFVLLSYSLPAQTSDLMQQFWNSYPEYKEESIEQRRIKHQDILPLIKNLEKDPQYKVKRVGKSIEGRDLFLISIGEGDTDVFLWSQMHGDESTATMAIFDIFNFFSSEDFKAEKEELLKKVKLHFLPMLNPDGAEVFQRRNALGIDVNRDALRLQSPEGKTLKRIRDSLEADFGFNLHDQSKYYNAEATANPATISFLAPAFDYEKNINDTRGNAMKVIVGMNKDLQKVIPGNVAKYNDDFEPRAFGDNIQKWGTSTILIESGGYLDDPEKQVIRKLNFAAILSAVFSIANKDFISNDIKEYEKIPENDSKLFDLKLTGFEYELEGETYILDLGINNQEISNENNQYYYRSTVADQGDLSTNYGYKTKDLSGYKVVPGKIYPKVLENIDAMEQITFRDFLAEGYSYVRVKNIPDNVKYTSFPVQVVKEDFKIPGRLSVGTNPTFFFEKDGKLEYAVINGFFTDLQQGEISVKNGLILK